MDAVLKRGDTPHHSFEHPARTAVADTAYLPFVDGLRAIAVIAVVAYHLDAALVPNGFLGVDIFFAISGFIVSYSIAPLAARGSFLRFAAAFYARRIIRIVPALLTVLLIVGLASFLFIPDAFISQTIPTTARWAFFGLSNIFLARGTDYFAPISEFNPFTHTWSLGVEEQFYLLFPLLIFPWLIGYRRTWSMAALALLAIASLAIWIHLSTTSPLSAFYVIHARFWQLAAGVLCFEIFASQSSSKNSGRRWSAPLIAGMALAALVGSLFIELPKPWSPANNIVAVLSTLVAIAVLCRHPGALLNLLSAEPIRFVGRISYSLYLWHWPVFVLARWTFGLETPLQITAALALTIAASLLSYFFVETPFRRSARIRRTPRLVVVAAGVCAILGAWAAFNSLEARRTQIALSTPTNNPGDWYPDAHQLDYARNIGCTVRERPVPVGALAERFDCDAPALPGRIFFLGDSHAGAYSPLLKRFTILTGIPSVRVNTLGCPVLPLRSEDDRCRAIAEQTLTQIESEALPGDVLFLPGLRMPRLTDQYRRFTDQGAWQQVYGDAGTKARAEAVARAIERLRRFTAKGVSVVFEAPKPVFRSPSFRCVDWFNRGNPSCRDGLTVERNFLTKIREPMLQAMAEISSSLPGVSVWDPFPLLCPNKTCEAIVAGKPLFFDGDHVSNYGNALLTESFCATMTGVLAGPAGTEASSSCYPRAGSSH